MKKSFLIIMLLALWGAAFAQLQTKPQWNRVLSDQPETFSIQLVSSSENSIQVNVQVPGFYTTNVTTPRGEAKVITMPKAISTAKAGEPEMPMTGIPAIIGDYARMDVRVLDAQYMDFEGIEVAPSKGDFSRQIDPATVPYTYGECYNQDAFFPSNNVGLYEPYIVRDFRGQNIVVYPYAYNPITKTLRVYYNMTVEMYKMDDHGTNVMETRRGNTVKMDPDFKSVYQRHFINYEASMNRYTALDEEGDLLIICYDNFISSMTDFVNWKKTRGINTTIVGTSTAGSTSSALKTYIQNQYNANNNLTHVLLVGDVAQIPGYSYSGASGYTGLGDNPYGQVVGNDIYNDVFIGRFSASSATQVTTQVNRTITYEKELTTSATWCQNGLGISASAGTGGHYSEDDYQHVENLRTDLLNYGYNTVYQDYASVSGYPSSSTTTISNHINSGVGIINYCNHGQETGWQSHYYMNSNVNALTNENKLPFIFSVACLVGKYDYSSGDCFAETWMHATNSNTPTGAIGGAFSYISQPWIPPMWAQDEFVDILVESYSNNIKRTLGGAAVNGMMAIFDNYSTSTASAVGTYQAWVLYGDPTLMLRTKTPQAMTVNHAGAIAPSASSYAVTVSNGNNAVATITDANHNILGKATVSNGTANVSISGTLTVGTELTLCVFGYNKVTYLGTINVIGSGNQYEITATASPTAGGTVTGAGTYYEDTQCTLTATPNRGYAFTNWKKNNSVVSNNATYTFTVTASGSYTANFTALTSHTVTCNATQNGSISATPTTAYAGETITLTATPAASYALESWSVKDANNNTIAVTDNQFTMPDSNVTVSATFVFQQEVEVTIGSGTGTTNGNYVPTNVWYKYSLTQQIYTAAELGDAGNITAISFYYNSSNSSGARALDIYMSHTTNSTISSWVTQSSNNLVYSNSFTFTEGWNTITLNTPFPYDGTSNLLLTVDDNTNDYDVSTSTYFYTYSTGANRAIRYYSDSNNLSATSSNSTSGTTTQYNAQMKVTKEIAGPSVPQYTVTASPNPVEGGTVAFGSKGNRDELTYDFEGGWQGWTTFQGNTTSPNSWMHNSAYPTSNNNFSTGYGYNSSDGFMLSESYISGSSNGSGTAVTPDNYLVSPQVRLGGSISFYAGARNTEYCAEKFSVMVSTTDNTNAASFTTVGTWTLSLSQAGYNSTPYTVDLSAYSGMGYIAIRHYDCYDQWFLCVDNVTIVEGEEDIPEDNTISGTFEENQSCTVTATANTGYHFVNWTENGSEVSANASYTFTVTDNRVLVANFSQEPVSYTITATASPAEGGTVSGGGTFQEGQSCTLTATAATGYNFTNWTKNGTVVSTNATYSFTVTEAATYVANFEVAEVQQTVTINSGWGWWSNYLNVTLEQLEEALGSNGSGITSQNDGFLSYIIGLGWQGGLNTLSPAKMYKIEVVGEVTMTLTGMPVDPADYPITLNYGDNWIGYPVSQSMSLDEAFAGANPVNGDKVSGYGSYAQYYNGAWYGELQTLDPGKGYVYNSKASTTKTFTFPSNGKSMK